MKISESLDEFKRCIADVAACGAILHSIAYGSEIERHLQAIAHLLPMYHQRHPISRKKDVEIGKKGKEEEEEDTDLLSVQPYKVASCWAPEK